MEAAKTEWLKKATEVFRDATIETAKDPKVMCVSQGLYSVDPQITWSGSRCANAS